MLTPRRMAAPAALARMPAMVRAWRWFGWKAPLPQERLGKEHGVSCASASLVKQGDNLCLLLGDCTVEPCVEDACGRRLQPAAAGAESRAAPLGLINEFAGAHHSRITPPSLGSSPGSASLFEPSGKP